jgi:hypothetical protein
MAKSKETASIRLDTGLGDGGSRRRAREEVIEEAITGGDLLAP